VRARLAPVLIWIGVLIAASLFVARLQIGTDMSAFLPANPSPAQRVLIDQLRDGVASRLALAAIEGVPPAEAASLSKALAARLRGQAAFADVENGEQADFARDRAVLWENRYVLSDRIDAAHFAAAALRGALRDDLDALGSSAGFLVKRTLAADPTGEFLYVLQHLLGEGGGGPARRDGVWMSPDGRRALLLVRLAGAGSDIDAAERALGAIRSAFASVAPASAARLVLTGPPVFAVAARARIKGDATRLSAIAALLVAAALLAVYRSARVLALAFVPVVSGALLGVAAVGLAFRSVHGITLGFGATLIGEAVDYAVYLFTQTPPGGAVGQTLGRIWPTLRLGVLTSICGFSAMLLSDFPGFAQLGVFTIAGLAAAVGVTRFVLPALLPVRFAGVRQSPAVLRAAGAAMRLRPYRLGVALLAAAAALTLAFDRGAFWAGDLASLSPVPAADQALDRALRQDMGAPDAAYLVVVRQADAQAALAASERVGAALAPAVAAGALAGFDAPGVVLPSAATQQARQAALPAPDVLRPALDAALAGLPFRPGLFDPFVADVAAARTRTLLTAEMLGGTALAQKLGTLLLRQGDGWTALLPLRGVRDPAAVARAVAGEAGAVFVDLKAESNRLLGVYLHEGVSLAALGAGMICLLLLVSLRSLRRLAAVVAPLAAAVAVTLAALRLGGHALSVFNLFGLLLVVAIGSNYCLFLDRHRFDPAGIPRVLASMMLANACTVAGFGVLSVSRTPVLHDLGLPVAIGTFLSLVFATIMLSPAPAPSGPASSGPASSGPAPSGPAPRSLPHEAAA
jgi:predicted exporter